MGAWIAHDGAWRGPGGQTVPYGSGDPADLPYWGTPVWRYESANEPDGPLDPDKWNVRNNFLTFDTARGMADNVFVQDGVMKLRGEWYTPVQSTGPQGTVTHSTGYIDTRDLTDAANPDPYHFSQMYGRWEVRCQTPTGPNTRGTLAAFWLRCDSGWLGEIDIMEAWGGGGTMHNDWTNYIKDSAVTTIHSSTISSTVNGKPYKKTFWRHWQHGGPTPVWDGMHTYGYERTPGYMSVDVDGVEIFKVTPTDTDPENGGTCEWLWDPDFFGGPLHMRMNLHIGPSASYWGLPDDNNRQYTQDPLDFNVEHVRVWAYEE